MQLNKRLIFKCIILIICLVAFKYKIRSQPYIPMLNGYSEWHVTNCYFGCSTDKYYTIGDTVINTLHYKFLDLFHYNKNFIVREDTASRKVYMRMLSDTGIAKEYLLYDFSVNINDTISIQNPGSPYPKFAGNFIVDSIRLKPLINKNHRYFFLHSLDTITSSTKNTIWVEGIGSLCLINTPGAMPQINGVGELSCFFNDGINAYQQLDSITDCIQVYPLGIDEKTASDIKITQNFDSESISISSLKNISLLTISIYDTDGRTIYHKENVPLPLENIYIGSLTKGLLILKTETQKGNYSKFKLFNP